MFDDILNQILEDLNNSSINNLDEYIYELHEILPNYIVNVPEQNSEEFYEFAGKIMQHVIDDNYLQELPITVAETFKRCPVEICNVNNALSSQSGEDITDDIIKILFCFVDASGNTLSYSEDLENTLDLIFTYINHDWVNMVGVILDWDRVCYEVLPSEDESDDYESDDYESDDYESDDYESDDYESGEDELVDLSDKKLNEIICKTAFYIAFSTNDNGEELSFNNIRENLAMWLLEDNYQIIIEDSNEDPDYIAHQLFDIASIFSEAINEDGKFYIDDKIIEELEDFADISWYKGPGIYNDIYDSDSDDF